jgi:hypothetical protein
MLDLPGPIFSLHLRFRLGVSELLCVSTESEFFHLKSKMGYYDPVCRRDFPVGPLSRKLIDLTEIC